MYYILSTVLTQFRQRYYVQARLQHWDGEHWGTVHYSMCASSGIQKGASEVKSMLLQEFFDLPLCKVST